MAGKKHEIQDLSFCSPTKAAKVEGVLTVLSPMKRVTFFDGRLADDSSSIRLVGFNAKKQEELARIQQSQQPVKIENCQIARSKYFDGFEVIVGSATTVTASSRKFSALDLTSSGRCMVSLKSLSDIDDYSLVDVTVKVINKESPLEVKSDLVKRDIIIADATGDARLTLWQDDIDKLDVGVCYNLEMLTVRSFNGTKYLPTKIELEL